MAWMKTLPALILLVLASWAIPVYEAITTHHVSIVGALTALMFTAMLIAWPFLMGRRIHQGHAERAVMCRDCKSLRWPGELSIGFCIQCGSMRAAVPVAS